MSYKPRRGDYGADIAYSLVEAVERVSCVHGCARAGDDSVIAEYGPGGNCDLLARLSVAEEIEEFDARPDGIHCSARTPRGTNPEKETATP